MSKVWDWIWNNKQWVFDGFGLAIVVAIIGFVVRRLKHRDHDYHNHKPEAIHSADQTLTQSGININVSPTIHTGQPEYTQPAKVSASSIQPTGELASKEQQHKGPNIEYRGSRIVTLPLDMDNHNLGIEYFNPALLDNMQAVVRVILAQFYFVPEQGGLPSINVKPHIFFDRGKDVYDALWYREEVETKNFTAGKAHELIVGILPEKENKGLGTYEYDRKPHENTFGQRDFFEPNIHVLEGNSFKVKIELICKYQNQFVAKIPFDFDLDLTPTPVLSNVFRTTALLS